MKDLRHWMLFAKVVELGGISAASRALSMPKATLSRAVSSLERDLGVRLLERAGRSLHVTEAGSVILSHCHRIAEEVGEAEAAIGSAQRTPQGRLRVASPLTFGRSMLSPLLAEFMQRYPEIKIELELTNRHVDPIEENFDVAIRLGPLPDSSLVAKVIGIVHFGLFASREYLQSHPPAAKPSDLAGLGVIDHFAGAEEHVWVLSRNHDVEPIKVKPRLDANDPIVRYDAAVAGLGIARLPSWLVSPGARGVKLLRVLRGWHVTPSTEIFALYPSRRSLSAKSRTFLAFLEERVPAQIGLSEGEPSKG